MSDKVAKLPSAQEIMKRLKAVDDDQYSQQTFHPTIAKNAADRELVGAGVVLNLTLGIHDACEGQAPVIEKLMQMKVPRYIDAIVDDKAVAEDAKNFYKEALSRK